MAKQIKFNGAMLKHAKTQPAPGATMANTGRSKYAPGTTGLREVARLLRRLDAKQANHP